MVKTLERLESLLGIYGIADLDAIQHNGTRFVFCRDEAALVKALPPDSPNLTVVTDNLFAGEYLKLLALYKNASVIQITGEFVTEAERIAAVKGQELVGFGGGRVLDVTKMAAHKSGAKLVLVPTAPTHDGLLSKNAALVNGDGKKTSYQTKHASLVIEPEHLWKKAGDMQISGRLDVLSNIVANQDVSLAVAQGKFEHRARDASFSLTAVSEVLHDGYASLANGLLLSGLAMDVSSHYCSGAEHEIEKLVSQAVNNSFLHGQIVGGATLLTAKLYQMHAATLPGNLAFDSATLYDDLRGIMVKHGWLDYALRPFREKRELIEPVLNNASAVRPERYTLWNTVNSEKVNWTAVLDEVLA